MSTKKTQVSFAPPKNTRVQMPGRGGHVKQIKVVLALHDSNLSISFECWTQKALPTTLGSRCFSSADLPRISDPALLHLTICRDLYSFASLSSFLLSGLVAFILQYYIPPGLNSSWRVFILFPVT